MSAAPVSLSKAAVGLRASEITTRPAVIATLGDVSSGGGSKEFAATADPGDGTFEFRPYGFTLYVSQGYDDNIYTSNLDKQESMFTTASLSGRYLFSRPRTSLQLAGSAGGSYYWDREGEAYDPNISASAEFRHVFSKKFSLSIGAYVSYQTEPDLQNGFGVSRRSGNYLYGNMGGSLTQQWSRRFSMVYSYSISGIRYEDSVRDFDNHIDQTAGLQFRYLVQPTVTAVGEYRFGVVTYDEASIRDSTSHYLLVGADFNVNRRLVASTRMGAQLRDSDDVGSSSSPFVESTLNYKISDNTSVTWINRYGFEESDSFASGVRQTYRTGLNASHRFSPRILGTFSGYYTHSAYDGEFTPDENTLDLTAGVSYAINRVFSLMTGYTYTQVFSDDIFREYERNRIYAGASASF